MTMLGTLCEYCEITWPDDIEHNCPVKQGQEEALMALVKHGTGEVLSDDDGTKTASKPEQTPEDKAALAEENEEEDIA